MNRLSDRAAEFLQEQYRHTLHYAAMRIATAAINIFAKEKLPEPQYENRYTERVYQEELIATMDWLHDKEMEGSTDCTNG